MTSRRQREPVHISVALRELFASLPSPSRPGDTEPCEGCGQPVEAIETVPGSGHCFCPQWCPACIERLDREQWTGEEDRLAVVGAETERKEDQDVN